MKMFWAVLLAFALSGCTGYYDVQKMAIEKQAEVDKARLEFVKDVLVQRAKDSALTGAFNSPENNKYANAEQIITAYDNQPGIKEIFIGKKGTADKNGPYQIDPIEMLATIKNGTYEATPHPAWQMGGQVLQTATPWLGLYGAMREMGKSAGNHYTNSNNSVGGDMTSTVSGDLAYTSTPTTQTDVGNDKSIDNSDNSQYANADLRGGDYNEGDQSVDNSDNRTNYSNATSPPTVVDPAVVNPVIITP